jgi:hypothetical protein
VTGPIAPCSGCGLRDVLCRCLEEQAAACARLVDPNVHQVRTAKRQREYEAHLSLVARRQARREGSSTDVTGPSTCPPYTDTPTMET